MHMPLAQLHRSQRRASNSRCRTPWHGAAPWSYCPIVCPPKALQLPELKQGSQAAQSKGHIHVPMGDHTQSHATAAMSGVRPPLAGARTVGHKRGQAAWFQGACGGRSAATTLAGCPPPHHHHTHTQRTAAGHELRLVLAVARCARSPARLQPPPPAHQPRHRPRLVFSAPPSEAPPPLEAPTLQQLSVTCCAGWAGLNSPMPALPRGNAGGGQGSRALLVGCRCSVAHYRLCCVSPWLVAFPAPQG